jgi:hypothetical protein
LTKKAGLHSVYIHPHLHRKAVFCRSKNPPARIESPVAFLSGGKWEKVEENRQKNVDEETVYFPKHFFLFCTYFFPPDPDNISQPTN